MSRISEGIMVKLQRMKRRLFAFAEIISLLLFVATAVLWVRSYWRFDTLVRTADHQTGAAIGARKGTIWVSWGRMGMTGGFHSGAYNDLDETLWDFYRTVASWRICGIYYITKPAVPVKMILIPALYPICFIAIAPAIWLLSWWRERSTRGNVNHCSTCGYDLTGNTSGVCPECGTTIANRPEAVA